MKSHKNQFNRSRKVAFTLFVLLIVVTFLIYESTENQLNLTDFQATARELGVWAPIVFVVFYAVGVIFLPSTPFMILSGILFGFKLGFLYSLIGGLTSSILVFKISRHLGKEWVENILQKKYLNQIERYNQRLGSNGLFDLIVLRILPIMPLNILNILMGISRISTRNYIIGTVFGLLPSILITVYFGNLLVRIF